MPQHYTVPTKNAFAALDDSDTEDRILARPPAAVQATEVPKTSPSRGLGAPQARKAPLIQTQMRPTRPAGGDDEGVPEEAPRSMRRGQPEERRMARQAVRPRDRDPARDARTGRRQFDRISGTGRGTEMKKQGAGSHNWGTPMQDAKIEAANAASGFGDNLGAGADSWADVTFEVSAPNATDEAPPAAAEGAAAEKKEPDAPKTLTYQEYLAAQEGKRVKPTTAEVEEPSAAELAKLEKEGYKFYTKGGSGLAAKKATDADDDEEADEKQRPKVMHLAEVAQQAGFRLNYGDRKPRSNPAQADERSRGRRQEEKKESGAPRGEINLSDIQAFPTLQAH